jgi:photosystem II stability/assembly factor-like uncharacterized protein
MVQYETSHGMSASMAPRHKHNARRRCAALVAVCMGAAWPAAAAPPLLLSLARTGAVVLAVGDHGTILRSSDGGIHFTPCNSPTQATLTRVALQPSGLAFATGFDATILRSTDFGAHWLRVQNDERADNPLFGVVESAHGSALAVGAFGRAYASVDGQHWQRTDILPADDDSHMNDAISVSPGEWLVVGEQALAMASSDAGAHWKKIDLPGQGTLFGALALTPEHWLVFGLRGHVMSTLDSGAHWQILDTGVSAELLGATALRDGRAVIVGNRGAVIIVEPDLHTAHAVVQPTRDNQADCLQLPDGTVIAVGEAGIVKLVIPHAPVAG